MSLILNEEMKLLLIIVDHSVSHHSRHVPPPPPPRFISQPPCSKYVPAAMDLFPSNWDLNWRSKHNCNAYWIQLARVYSFSTVNHLRAFCMVAWQSVISWVSFGCFLFSFLYCFKHSLRKALWLVTLWWGLNKLVQLLKVSAGYSHCHLMFSLSVWAPGREGHFLYAGRAGLPQVQRWISFHESANQGSLSI